MVCPSRNHQASLSTLKSLPNPALKAERPTTCFLSFRVFISSFPLLVLGGGLAQR